MILTPSTDVEQKDKITTHEVGKTLSNDLEPKSNSAVNEKKLPVAVATPSASDKSKATSDATAVDSDDNLINELEQMEGLKKEEVLASNASGTAQPPQPTSETSDLLKDLEDEPVAIAEVAAESKLDKAKIDGTNGNGSAADVDMGDGSVATDEVDRAQVDSTTEAKLKRKHSEEDLAVAGGMAKKQNTNDSATENVIVVEKKSTEVPSTSEDNAKKLTETVATAKVELATAKENNTASKKNTEVDTAISSTSSELNKKNSKSAATGSQSTGKKTSETVTKEQAKLVSECAAAKKPVDVNMKAVPEIEEAVTSTDDDKNVDSTKKTSSLNKSSSEADSSQGKTVATKKPSPKAEAAAATTTASKVATDKSVVKPDPKLDSTTNDATANADVSIKEKSNVVEKMDVDDDAADNTGDNADAKHLTVQKKTLTNMMNNGSSTPNSNNASTVATSSINITPIQKQQMELSAEDAPSNVEKTVADDTAAESSEPSEDIKTSDTTGKF